MTNLLARLERSCLDKHKYFPRAMLLIKKVSAICRTLNAFVTRPRELNTDMNVINPTTIEENVCFGKKFVFVYLVTVKPM